MSGEWQRLLAELDALVVAARTCLEQGELPDVAALTRATESLRRQIGRMEVSEGTSAQLQLAAFALGLEGLVEATRRSLARTRDELEACERQRRALAAYRQSGKRP
ncbi:hypothetical protein HRbin40_00212 [bacterium HR40]|nr:hypothetical protein HRbin40_00212 [bacterium HR40]